VNVVVLRLKAEVATGEVSDELRGLAPGPGALVEGGELREGVRGARTAQVGRPG
jgi:hypothetical protein